MTICAGLWATGNLQILGPGLSVAFRKPLSPPASLPDVNAVAPLPAPPVPPEGGATVPPAQADADRVVPPPAAASIGTVPPASLHLALPLKGIDVSKIPDSYNDARSGHTHEAIDIMAPRGTPVMAVAEGNVAKLFTSKQGGLDGLSVRQHRAVLLLLRASRPLRTRSERGNAVTKGDVLGYVGSTGDAQADAPHLHLAVFRLGPEKKWWEGTPINPLPLLK